jgi:hypothetical protein
MLINIICGFQFLSFRERTGDPNLYNTSNAKERGGNSIGKIYLIPTVLEMRASLWLARKKNFGPVKN